MLVRHPTCFLNGDRTALDYFVEMQINNREPDFLISVSNGFVDRGAQACSIIIFPEVPVVSQLQNVIPDFAEGKIEWSSM